MIFARGEGTSVFMKGLRRGRREGKMPLSAPGHPRKCAKPHPSGKIHPVLQYFKATAEKDPAFALSPVCLLCSCEAPVIPRGFGSEVQWVWMLSTLKIKLFLPQNDEKPMTAPLFHVSEKGWGGQVGSCPSPHGTDHHPRPSMGVPRTCEELFFLFWGFLTSLRGTWG